MAIKPFVEIGNALHLLKEMDKGVSVIHSHLGDALSAGKTVTMTGEEEIPHYFHGVCVMGGEITITYGSSKTKTIRNGPYGARISKATGRRLNRVLSAKEAEFQCSDTDEERLTIFIR